MAINQQNYRLVLVREQTLGVEETLDALAQIIDLGDKDRHRILRETGLARVERLYASPLTLEAEGSGALGVFVAFVGERGAAETVDGHWLDLREACGGLGPGWSDVLAAVRERFVARPPDEALRLR